MLYDRIASIVVGKDGGTGREIKDLRFAFDIQKGAVKHPNACKVKIYNANPDTRTLLEAVGNVLILKAGYKDDIGAITIFSGDVVRSLTVKDGPDWVTELELEDGFMEFRDSKTSVSFPKGATTEQVIKVLAEKFKLPLRPLPEKLAAKQYKNGFAFVGRVRNAMDKACEYQGLEWSIQNREIQVIKKGGVFQKVAVVLSAETGMLGSPSQEAKTMTDKAAAELGYKKTDKGVQQTTKRDEHGELKEVLKVEGYKVRSLLQPTIEPGGFVQVKSIGINGEFFRVEELKHVGDTHGKEWETHLTLRYPRNG